MTKARRASCRGGRRNRTQATDRPRFYAAAACCAVLSFTTESTEDTEEDSSNLCALRVLCGSRFCLLPPLDIRYCSDIIRISSCRCGRTLSGGKVYECLAGT